MSDETTEGLAVLEASAALEASDWAEARCWVDAERALVALAAAGLVDLTDWWTADLGGVGYLVGYVDAAAGPRWGGYAIVVGAGRCDWVDAPTPAQGLARACASAAYTH